MMKKTDIHLHMKLERQPGVNGTWISGAGEMLSHLEELGIGKGIVLSAGENPDSLMCSNKEALKIHRAFPEVYEFMCNVDETVLEDGMPQEMLQEKVYALFSRYKKEGAVGIGELVINRRIDNPLVQAVFAAGEQLKLPITFHMSPEEGYSYGIVDEPGLPLLEKALMTYPNGIFLGHSPTFWIEISGDAPIGKEARNQWGKGPIVPGGRVVELFEKYPNLYGDLSANSAGQAIMREPEFGLGFLERFADRLLFGTDMVNTEMEFPLGPWLDRMAKEGKLSKEAYGKIVCGNAKRVYGI